MPIGGGPDTCGKQITFDYPDTMTGQVRAPRSAGVPVQLWAD